MYTLKNIHGVKSGFINKDRIDFWLGIIGIVSKEITGHENRNSEAANEKTEKMHQFQPCMEKRQQTNHQSPCRAMKLPCAQTHTT